ncbi:MAG: Lrp/AsnC ligand binding domain-containing protein [Nanoarchaeota archaeon]
MVEAFILITVEPGQEREVFDKLRKLEEVKSINEIYGEWDIILKLEVNDIRKVDLFVTEKISRNPNVKATSTMIVAR